MAVIQRSLIAVASMLFAAATLAQTPAPQPSPDYSQQAFIVEQSATKYRFENDGTGRRTLFMRVRVNSEAGVQTWGQLAFPYNAANERMDVEFVRVLKTNGEVVTAAADAVQDLSSSVQHEAPVYTDTREKHITVPALRPGEVLELSLVTTVHTPLAPGHFWAEHQFIKSGIVLDDSLRIEVPADRKITLKTQPGIEQTDREVGDRHVYEWRTARRTIEDESAKEKRRGWSKRSEPERASVRLTTFATWEELGRWYRELERTQRVVTPEIRAQAAKLTRDRKTDIEKLEALYEYVASNFRYVSLSFGVGRYQPHAAGAVLHNEYGDCKDKHTLLATLASSIGLHASAALINSSVALDADFPSPTQFDHVITRVSVGSETVWLDATTEVAPFRLLMPTLRNKQALVVDAGGMARLEETPAGTPVISSTSADIDASVSDSGMLNARIRMTFRGDYELLMRTLFRAAPKAQWKTILENLGNRSGLDGEVSNWKVANPAALRDPFTVEYQVAKANFVNWTTKRFNLKLPLADAIGPLADDDSDDGEADEAAAPIELGSTRTSTYKLRIELPRSFTAHTPVAMAMARDYGEYRAAYTLAGGVFTADRSLSIHQSELASSRRGDYAAFTAAVSRDLRQPLAVENNAAAVISAPAQLNAADLSNSGTRAVDDGHYSQGVVLLKRAVELEPSHRSAWTNLGRAYMGLHQMDAAIDAFRKQIDINPFDRHAYNNLGYAYRTQQKFTEAEAAFRKQLEVDPLDPFAHESLGGLFLEQHDYRAAAPELEKAVALSPRKAAVHVRLGEALLNLGDVDRARAMFSRAVELEPAPSTWNEVAYQLALNRIHLDLAQRYAESAVAAVTAATRPVSIESVTAADLSHVGSLAAYWDTLGWVRFAQGDLARAERFVHASWSLLQNAEVGDHLAQIYEKQGRRDEAIRAYALAMNAERPVKGTRERFGALVGGVDRADDLARERAADLTKDRTIAVDAPSGTTGVADFLILLDNASSSAAVVENVTFISGDDAMRSAVDALRNAQYGQLFPDAAPARIVRRGTLSCSASERRRSCNFVMMLPADAQVAQQQ